MDLFVHLVTLNLIFLEWELVDLAKDYETPSIRNLPIGLAIRVGGDSGKPIVYFNPESVSAKDI